ncbi:MAG: glycoside hydrolase family 88 protein [Clostridium sp.]|nr:glycoside hydrolase family 88 protein [Clostridium sp.]
MNGIMGAWDREAVREMEKRVNSRMMNMKNPGMEEQFPVSLIDMDCWEWPQGVGLYGMYRNYQMEGDSQVLAFLTGWFDRRMTEGGMEKNVNTTAPMLTLTYLYEITGKAEYREFISSWARWMMDEAGLLRAGEGCFQHMITGDPNDGEILIDTLFMAVFFLARAGKLLGREEMVREADYQILNHIRFLLNRETGLFYHGWNFRGNHNYGKVMWGCGNGWYTMGIMEYLEQMGTEDPLRRYFLSVFSCQARALKRYQNQSTGLWHTVIDNPATYEETSASAAFLAGIMKGVRLGYLEREEFEPVIAKGIPGVLGQIAEDGTVLGVSYGTPIGWNEDFYNEIVRCPITYGQAMTILLLQEIRLL